MSDAVSPRYDGIGHGYSAFRHEDPEIARRIHAALGDAKTVVNVGAGTGSYEPADRQVIAIEPSAVMVAQRPPHRAPAVRAFAGALPLADKSVDAAMAVLTLHHWEDEPAGVSPRIALHTPRRRIPHSPSSTMLEHRLPLGALDSPAVAEHRSTESAPTGSEAQARGVAELRRVARGPVVILTYDPEVSAQMWLMADYLHEVAELDRRTFPAPELLAQWLGGARIEPVLLAADTPDWMLGSYWAHPERVLDEGARNATSGFARQAPATIARVVADVSRDLADGTWAARHGHLRQLNALDVGLRLVVAH